MRQVGYLQELNRDARSTKHLKSLKSRVVICIEITVVAVRLLYVCVIKSSPFYVYKSYGRVWVPEHVVYKQ